MIELAISNGSVETSCVAPPDPASQRPPPRLSELAGRLGRTIGLARALVQGGRELDLTGIDDGIGVLCAQTLDLSPDQAHAMLPTIYDLRTQIDSLGAALRLGKTSSDRQPC